MRSSAPTIETERLILRQYRKDDFAAHYAIVSDPAVMRHFSGPTMPKEESWRRMSAAVGSWPLLGFGGWAATCRTDGKLIGMVSLFNAWRALEPEFGEEPEMGWIFATEVHGQGVAGEACRAVLEWADGNLQPTPVWAIIAPSNEPSLRLAGRLGFEFLRETEYHDEATVVLRRAPRA